MTTEDAIDWPLIPIASLVPHQDRMSLLDRVLRCEGDELEAEVIVAPDQLFMDSQGAGQGLGAWVGIEWMAQAVAAWAGVQGPALGQAPRIGLLLGCRRYRSTQARFVAGERLRVQVRREFQADNGLGQFNCRLLKDGIPHGLEAGATEEVAQEVAQAQLTVFGPENPQEFLKESGHHE